MGGKIFRIDAAASLLNSLKNRPNKEVDFASSTSLEQYLLFVTIESAWGATMIEGRTARVEEKEARAGRTAEEIAFCISFSIEGMNSLETDLIA